MTAAPREWTIRIHYPNGDERALSFDGRGVAVFSKPRAVATIAGLRAANPTRVYSLAILR